MILLYQQKDSRHFRSVDFIFYFSFCYEGTQRYDAELKLTLR